MGKDRAKVVFQAKLGKMLRVDAMIPAQGTILDLRVREPRCAARGLWLAAARAPRSFRVCGPRARRYVLRLR
jgi:hypothetical protein